jgi:PAS domain S-box-containing protein
MEQLPGSLKPAWRIVIGAFAYAIAYIVSTRCSLSPPLATLWLCSGVSLYVLLRLPVKWWKWQLLVTAITWLCMSVIVNHLPLKFTTIGVTANVIDPLIAALIIRHYVGRRIDISQIRHITILLVAIWIATLITANLGAYAVMLMQGGGTFWQPMFRWALSGGMGTLLVVWTMLSWTTPECYEKLNVSQLLERVFVLGMLLGLTWVMFRYPMSDLSSASPKMHLRTLPMIWVLIRFGPRAVSMMISVSVGIILINAVTGHGPYGNAELDVVGREISLVSQQLISAASCILICSVITDRSRVAKQRLEVIEDLRRTRQSLEAIIDHSPLPILMLDHRNHVQIWNKAAENVFGWKAEEVAGIHIPTIPDDRREQHLQFAEHVRQGGVLNGVLIKRWCKDGSVRDVQTYVAPLMSHDWKYEGCVVVYVDKTEALRNERETNRLRQLLQNMIDSMPSILAGLDMRGNITHWNQQAVTTTGLSAEAVHGTHVAVALPMLESHIGAIQSALEQNKIVQQVRVTWEVDGIKTTYEMTVYPLIEDTMQGVVVRLDDVTEQLKLTEAVIQSEKMMSVGGLAAGMAHEINNPLAGMMQCAQVIENRLTGDIPANQRAADEVGTTMQTIQAYALARELPDLLQDINETGARAARIVDNMLRYARKDEGLYRRIDINSMLDKTLEIARSDYDLRKRYDFQAIELIREYCEELPLVQCQETEIQQVILNLVKNAAEAMWMHREEMSLPPKLILRTFQNGDDVCIEVEDNGPGIEKAVCRRLFEPFFTTKPAGVGTGLGLAVSSYIVSNNHGGCLDVRSEVGHGACFVVKLPVAWKAGQG